MNWALALSTVVIMLAFSHVRAEQYVGANINQGQLGQGFDSHTSLFRETCVMGDVVSTNNSESVLSFTASNSLERHIEETYGKVKGGVSLVIFSGSVSSALSSKVTDSARTASSSVKLLYNAKDFTLENRTLSAYARSVLDQDDIDTVCGDAFVYHVKEGLEIQVVAKLYFRSVEDYQKWVTKVKVRFLFYSKTKTKTEEWHSLTENAVYSIEVVTRGGMTTRLQAILDSNPTYCNTDHMDACIDTGEMIFAYLFGEMGYSADIKNSAKQGILFSTEGYLASGHFDLAKPIFNRGNQFFVEEARINSLLYSNQQIRDSLYAFAQVEADELIRERLLQKISLADANVALLDQAALVCRTATHWLSCQQAVNWAVSGQRSVEP